MAREQKIAALMNQFPSETLIIEGASVSVKATCLYNDGGIATDPTGRLL
jgi:hypothetical protein